MNILDQIRLHGPVLPEILGTREKLFDPELLSAWLDQIMPHQRQKIMKEICQDLFFFKKHDPASDLYYIGKILSLRRGMVAVAAHRVFSALLNEKVASYRHLLFEVERLATKIQAFTNVEIHPEAQIRSPFAIDHGHGTIIGATAQMGAHIFLYHGVTLGASQKQDQNNHRHPQMGNNLFLGNGVQVLGPCVLGNNVVIGSDSIIIDSILGDQVRVSPGVKIQNKKIPEKLHIIGFEAFSNQHIVRNAHGEALQVMFEKAFM